MLSSSLLQERRSVPAKLLAEPAPDDARLLELLQLASRVPDHGALGAWRFLSIRGDARARLGALLAARHHDLNPEAAQPELEREAGRFLRAPLVVVVIGCYQPHHKVPVVEQQMTAGCVCFSLLMAAQAAGFGAQWLTGWAAYDAAIGHSLGLAGSERIVGFIHIGTPEDTVPERRRPDARERLQAWKG